MIDIIEKPKICSNCYFNKYDTQDFYCSNEKSDFFTDYTDYIDSCEFYEPKEEGEE